MEGPSNTGNNLKWVAVLINRSNESYNHLSPPPLLDMRWLPSQCVLYCAIVFIGKGEEPPHVNVAIGANNQLIVATKNIDCRLEPYNRIICFSKEDMIVHLLGCG